MTEPQADDYFVVEHPVAVPPTQQNTLTPQESNDSFYGMSGDSTPVTGMPEPIAEPSSMPAAPLFPEPSPFPRDSGLARYDYNKSPGLPSPPKASLIAEAVFPTRPDSSDTLDLLREPPRKEEHAQGTYDPLLGTYMSPMSTTGSITGGPVYASPPEFRYASPPDFPYADTPATLENSVSPLNNSLLQTPLDNPLLHTPSPHYDMDPPPLSGALMHPMPQDRSSRTASRTASRTTSRSTTTGSPSPRTELLTPTPTPGPAPSVGTATMYTHPSFDSRTSSSRSSASRPTSESFSERERDRERRHESRRQKERERAHRHSEERRHNEELRHEEERQQDEARRHNEGHRHSERQYDERRHDEHRRTEQQPGEHQHRHKKHSHKDSQSRTNLVSLIMEEETRVAQSRHALAVAQAQLAAESRRAGESEATALRTMQALRDAVDTRASAERERNRVVEELALYRAQHTLALAEIARAQDILDKAEEARAEAVETATRAKEKARRMRDEHAVTKAREQGRKEGFREGVQWGRRVGLEEGRSHEHEDGARRPPPAIQLHSSEEGPETIQEEDESLEDDNDGASLLERRGPPSVLHQPMPRERRMHQFAPSRGTHEHQGVPRETHGGGGTFSPVGATRPNMHASQAAAMLAGAGYMPAAHAAMDEEDEEDEEGRKTPRQYRVPPDNLIPIVGPDGRIAMPPPNEMSGAPSAVGSALSAEDGAAVRRPFSAPSNAASTTSGMTGFTGVTGVTGVSRAPAPRVRDFSGYAAVPIPNGARHDGRLSIIPEVGSSMEVTPVPLPRPIPVPGAPDEYFSEQDEPEEEAYTPPPAPSQEPPTRQRARNVLTRIANKLGGGLSRKNDPPTFRDMPDDEGGWVDINGRSMPTPTTDAPPGPARLTKHQRTASENSRGNPAPVVVTRVDTASYDPQGPRVHSAISSLPGISVVAPSLEDMNSSYAPSNKRTSRQSMRPQSSMSSAPRERERSRSPNGPRVPSPSPSSITRSYSPSGRRIINLDEPLPPPSVAGSQFSHTSTRQKPDPPRARPQSTAQSQRGYVPPDIPPSDQYQRPDIRRQASGSSIASRASGYGRYDPSENLDPAFLASPLPEHTQLPSSESDPAMYGHNRHRSRSGSEEAAQYGGYPTRPNSTRWQDPRRFPGQDG